MSHLSPGSLSRYLLALALTASVAMADPLPPFAGKSHGFNIAVSDASTAVREFGKQSGVQIMVSGELLKGKKLNPVTGEHSTDAALKILLADSGLTHRYVGQRGVVLVPVGAKSDVQSGAYTGQTVDLRLAEAQSVAAQSTSAQSDAEREAARKESDEIEVSSSRIDGLNNKGLLQGGANGALYHDVITREDIERMGVTSLEELFRRIPQTSSAVTSLQRAEDNTQITGGDTINFSTMGLRGFDASDTVILVNGRALPRTTSWAGPDLSRIPVAAIERIDILPYAGSAIYGSGAVGGAINVILRKEFTGKDLSVYVGTTTDGGAAEQRITYLDGRTFNEGRTSLTTTFSFQHRDSLNLGDRDYVQRALDRFGPDSGVVSPEGNVAFEQYMIPALAGPRAVILLNSPVGDLGIPGAPGARYAVVPAGTSAAASLALTPSSFTSTARQVGSGGGRYDRTNLYQPMDSTSLNAQGEHEFIKDRLSLYTELTASYNRRNYSYPGSFTVGLDEENPLNPFRNDVTPGFVGRPVTVYLDPVDQPDNHTTSEYRSRRAVVGLKGRINSHWDWSADVVYDRNRNTFMGTDTLSQLGRIITSTDEPLPGYGTIDQRLALYPLLADHSAYPSDLDNGTYFLLQRRSWSDGDQKEGNARLTGDLFNVPAGPFRISITGKYQDWESTTGQYYAYASTGNRLIGIGSDGDIVANEESTDTRSLWQTTVEFTLPIIGKQWRPIPVESLELQGSASYESINTTTGASSYQVAEDFTRKADSQAIAMKLQIVRDIAVRASYSTAFNPPGWGVVNSSSSSSDFPGGFFFDAARGELTGPFTYVSSGNPDLQPELATSRNVGVMLTPRFLNGFSMNIDYWRTKKRDAISYPDIFRLFTDPNYTLGVVRAPSTGDLPGVLIEFRSQPFNAASVQTEGIDVRMSQVLETAGRGSFTFNANGSFVNNFLQQDTAGDVPLNTINASGPLKWRGSSSVTWTVKGFSSSITGRYTTHYSTPFTAPSEVYPTASGFDGRRIPGSLIWDLQVSYEMAASGGSGLWNDIFAGSKWSLGANNVLNEEPAYMTGLDSFGGGTSFYDQNADPRQRFVYLSVRKSF